MATMSRYCKAYAIESLRAFDGWKENIALQPADVIDEAAVDGEAPNDTAADAAADASPDAGDTVKGTYVFLHENYHVTANVFVDEEVVFDGVSPEWIDFCTQRLEFKVPDDVIAASEQAMEA